MSDALGCALTRPPRPVDIAIVAGETSGDLLAASLLPGLQAALPRLRVHGIGGDAMAAAGVECHQSSARLAVHGYLDALRRYRELSAIRDEFCEQLLAEPPALFIGVDAPDFNLGLARRLKAAGVPTMQLVCPSVWAWRGERIRHIASAVDTLLCLFPFEPALFAETGVDARFIGHPFADQLPRSPDRDSARAALGVSGKGPVIAVLPGSRDGELRHLGVPMIDAMRLLHQRDPDTRFLVPLVSGLRARFEALLARYGHGLPVSCLQGQSIAAMTAADVVLAASGTAVLEAALLKRPAVVCYRMNPLQYALMRRMAYLPWVSLPNILCRAHLLPEHLQADADGAQLAASVAWWLEHPRAVQLLQLRFEALHRTLRQGAADRALAAILARLGFGADR